MNCSTRPQACGATIEKLMLERGADGVKVETVRGDKGSTDCIKVFIHGKNGKSSGGTCPPWASLAAWGGLGARPEVIGFTSDGDGALAALPRD